MSLFLFSNVLCTLLVILYYACIMYLCFNPANSCYAAINHSFIHTAGVGIAFFRVCLIVFSFFRALKGKRLELSPPNFVHVYSIGLAVARGALTQRSKGQRSR